MKIVQKFGGTSVADIARIKKVANIVAQEKKQGNDVLVVVSAMSGTTNKLIEYARKMSQLLDNEHLAEYDTIVASGEQITAGLLALQLQNMGFKSRSFLGWQLGIQTDSSHSKSKIQDIDKATINKFIKAGFIPVVAGFQGVTEHKRIATMGRGGSDTSAVAIAASIKADRCDIYTDVAGFYTADPRIVADAKKFKMIGYSEAIEMTALGAKILHTRSVEIAMKSKIPLQVLSSFSSEEGTLLVQDEKIKEKKPVAGIANMNDEAVITLQNTKNVFGVVASITKILSSENINIDMILQNISYDGKHDNISFTAKNNEVSKVKKVLKKALDRRDFYCEKFVANKNIAKISIIGIAMQYQTGVAHTMFQTMADHNINIMAIATSEIKISILIEKDYCELAVRLLHNAFDLGK